MHSYHKELPSEIGVEERADGTRLVFPVRFYFRPYRCPGAWQHAVTRLACVFFFFIAYQMYSVEYSSRLSDANLEAMKARPQNPAVTSIEYDWSEAPGHTGMIGTFLATGIAALFFGMTPRTLGVLLFGWGTIWTYGCVDAFMNGGPPPSVGVLVMILWLLMLLVFGAISVIFAAIGAYLLLPTRTIIEVQAEEVVITEGCWPCRWTKRCAMDAANIIVTVNKAISQLGRLEIGDYHCARMYPVIWLEDVRNELIRLVARARQRTGTSA